MGEPIRVLVMEDDPAARLLVTAAFPQLPGLELCGVAADGLEGLELTARLHPHAVLLDLVMPGLDGLGVLSALSKLPRRPVAVVTSQISNPQVIHLALSLGASYYLVKPIHFQALPQLLSSLCLTPLADRAAALLETMGASGMGVAAAARAAAVLCRNPDALLKEAYAPTITQERTSYASVEKNIRSMVDKLQAAAHPDYRSLLGGLPSSRPSNLVFLRALAARLKD